MDIEFLRSISEVDQTDIMMMDLDKLPDLSGVFINKDIPSTDFLEDPPNYSLHHSNFLNPNSPTSPGQQTLGGEMQLLPEVDRKRNSMAAMREMIFRMAAMQPININPEAIKPPKRRNVRISKDPQSVAARHRRERISERIRILQRLVPGGTKMDTASMLDEAIHYLKFLKNQVQTLEKVGENNRNNIGFPVPMWNGSYVGNVCKGLSATEAKVSSSSDYSLIN